MSTIHESTMRCIKNNRRAFRLHFLHDTVCCFLDFHSNSLYHKVDCSFKLHQSNKVSVGFIAITACVTWLTMALYVLNHRYWTNQLWVKSCKSDATYSKTLTVLTHLQQWLHHFSLLWILKPKFWEGHFSEKECLLIGKISL